MIFFSHQHLNAHIKFSPFYWMMSYLLIILAFLMSCTTKAGKHNLSESDPDKEVVSFIYHRFGDDRYPSTNVSLADFESHLKYLRDHKFSVMTLGKALEYIKDPGQPLEGHVVVLTVDDGFSTFYTNAMPLLKKYGMGATLFINPESVGGADYMTWSQLGEAIKAGIEIGNHSYSHDHFLNYGQDERAVLFRENVVKAEAVIAEKLGITTEHFAYPYGEYDEAMINVLKSGGYKSAVGQYSGVSYSETSVYALPRFSMVGALSGINGFVEKANMKALRIREVTPSGNIISKNAAPSMKVVLDDPARLDFRRMQCFIQGADCSSEVLMRPDTSIVVKPGRGLHNRRHLYTLTIPDKDGRWHWFSKLWINPDIPE